VKTSLFSLVAQQLQHLAPRPNPALIVPGGGWGFEPELGSRRGLGMEVADLPSAETN
jgi:hypothetical protein